MTEHHFEDAIDSIKPRAASNLLLWAVAAAVGLAPQGYEGAVRFLSAPVNATLAVLLVVLGAYHVHLVMKEAIEDYIGDHHRRIALLLLNAAVALVAGALSAVSILKVAFSAA